MDNNETTIDPRFTSLRDALRAHGTSYAYSDQQVNGVASLKVQAFVTIRDGAKAGYVFEGQAETLARDWAAAANLPLAENSVKSAASKVKVWIKAGRSNHAGGEVEAMAALAQGSYDKAKRFFEKCCTAMRKSLAEGRPLTDAERDEILVGGSDVGPSKLELLAKALAAVVSGYKRAVEADPTPELQALHADAEKRHASVVAAIKLQASQTVATTAPAAPAPAAPAPAQPQVVQSNPQAQRTDEVVARVFGGLIPA
jgi:hypothetical protein